MATRREFLQGTLAGLGGTLAPDGFADEVTGEPAQGGAPSGGISGVSATSRTGSDVGSLYPFIRSQAVRGNLRETRESAEREHILRALEEAEWNVSSAARALGMERTNLHKRIKALGIEREK